MAWDGNFIGCGLGDESKPSLVSSLANEDKNEQGVDDDDDDEDDSSSSLSPLSLDERRAVYDYVVEVCLFFLFLAIFIPPTHSLSPLRNRD